MPFRLSDEYRKLLEQQKRTGEPFPTYTVSTTIREASHGKSYRSFTENMRNSLYSWMEKNTGSIHGEIQFDYKLSRHKVIHVIGERPYLKHDKLHGRGYRGFILELVVRSIDGIPCKTLVGRRTWFSWDRIRGREKLLLLPEGAKYSGFNKERR